jgi:hypothetical protein
MEEDKRRTTRGFEDENISEKGRERKRLSKARLI